MESYHDRNCNLYYMLPLRCIIFLLVFMIAAVVFDKQMQEISNWWSIIASIVNIGTIWILVSLAKKQGMDYWQLIHYQKGETTWKQIVGMVVIILLVGMAGMYLAGYVCYGVIPYAAPMIIAPIPLWLATINIIVLPISTAFAEDGLYLGCGVNQINIRPLLFRRYFLRCSTVLFLPCLI